jgi:hypothetical protein
LTGSLLIAPFQPRWRPQYLNAVIILLIELERLPMAPMRLEGSLLLAIPKPRIGWRDTGFGNVPWRDLPPWAIVRASIECQQPMRPKRAGAFLSGAALLLAVVGGGSGFATAQVDCDAIPAGPARTDCYIGLSRINRQKSEIAAGVARQQTDSAIYRDVTGNQVPKRRRNLQNP